MGSDGTAEELAPPAFLRLVGHDLRWRLLSELGRSDRRVHELTGLLDEPQNLVSYHLGALRRAGLVSTRRSAADGRDTYYRADLTRIGSLLTATGSALHPGLRLHPSPAGADARRTARPRVLFLCTGNSARSQIAEALTHLRSGGLVEARSAGSHPKPLHPNAVRVMRERHDLDLSGHRPKHLDTFADERFDRLVSLCDRVREACPELPGPPEASHWSLADPSSGGPDHEATYPAFEATLDELEVRIGFLLASLHVPDTHPTTPTPQEVP